MRQLSFTKNYDQYQYCFFELMVDDHFCQYFYQNDKPSDKIMIVYLSSISVSGLSLIPTLMRCPKDHILIQKNMIL